MNLSVGAYPHLSFLISSFGKCIFFRNFHIDSLFFELSKLFFKDIHQDANACFFIFSCHHLIMLVQEWIVQTLPLSINWAILNVSPTSRWDSRLVSCFIGCRYCLSQRREYWLSNIIISPLSVKKALVLKKLDKGTIYLFIRFSNWNISNDDGFYLFGEFVL